MVRSMTAYGRSEVALQEQGRFVIEITSVNRKGLDITVYAPKELSRLEIGFRKQIAEHLFRGSVTLRLSRSLEGEGVSHNLPTKENFKLVYDHLAMCCEYSGMSVETITPSMVTQSLASNASSLVPINEEDQACLKEALDKALKDVIDMGDREGKALQEAMQKTLSEIEARRAEIDEMKREAIGQYREKLKKKIEQIDHGVEDFEERLAREVILFSEKIDIEEELVRLASHLTQFGKVLEEAGDVKKGKKLEFLTQEIHRETNTIASKSYGLEVINLALQIKGLVKTLVEQIQNIV